MRFDKWIELLSEKIEENQFIEFKLIELKPKEFIRTLIPEVNGQFIIFHEAFSGLQTSAVPFGKFKSAVMGTDKIKIPERLQKIHPRLKDKTAIFMFTDEFRFGECVSLEFSHVSTVNHELNSVDLIFVKRDR